ncbi:uncharacterized protein LOC134778926 [Penaeus indicus]|uniref:uncharacterized protein LOC134778926 n=1 Tax=Penaeus indicus TaxID=29960 RepID=UPI00300C2C48
MSDSASNDTENETSNKKWKTLRTSMMEAALESFGKSRPPKEDWMAEFAITLDPLLEAKSEAHRVHNNRPTRASHRALHAAQSELQRTSRACANQFWNTLCDEIQTTADIGNQRKLYLCLRKVEHYSELYGEPRGISAAAALEATPNLDVMMELDQTPTIEELVIALSHIPSGKSSGADGIPADLLKCDASLLPHLYKLLCKCWRDAAFPADMKDANIVTLYTKKATKEKCREQNRPLHMAFVDLTKAFNMVSREGMFAVLQKLGCPPTLLKLIRSLHDDMQATISFEGAMSEHFGVRSGVKQGCSRRFAKSDFSLIISTKKTVVMNSATNSPSIPIFVEDQELNVADKFCYLGSTISTDLTHDREMEVRIGKTSTAFSRLRARAWNNRLLTERTKTRIYETCVVLSVLLYGSECGPHTPHMRNLRRIISVSWKDHVTNEEVLTRTGSHSTFYILKAGE